MRTSIMRGQFIHPTLQLIVLTTTAVFIYVFICGSLVLRMNLKARTYVGIHSGYKSGDLSVVANKWGKGQGKANAGEFHLAGKYFEPYATSTGVSYQVFIRDSTLMPKKHTQGGKRCPDGSKPPCH